METTYRLNARDLAANFLESVREAFLDRDIEITVLEAEPPLDETESLLRSPANRERLLAAVKNVERGENIIMFDSVEQAIQCAREQAAQ